MNALIVVDVQNDFCPGGALAAPEGDRVVPVINRIEPGDAARAVREMRNQGVVITDRALNVHQ